MSYPAQESIIKTLGILAALAEEVSALLDEMGPTAHTQRIGMRDYHQGVLYGQPCVIALTRVGKVAAAATTATLLHEFNVERVVFTGVAGGIAENVQVGDVVIGSALAQHDLDARPFFPRFEVPLLHTSRFATSDALSALLLRCAAEFLAGQPAAPAAHLGLIATGDQFLNSAQALARLRADMPEALCVEMEGAAVAQVCHEFGVPCAVMRTVSDRADDDSHIDFPLFLRDVASVYSAGILRRFLATLPELTQAEEAFNTPPA
ncbi:MAG TPA: 5'-methylthioadenosine/adenosylhomocysteine nucleosidase [Bordetella sp.]|uniref:5'-methylthioadenosine/adenosylhomocysteine nucleosidase n=1 Tax=Bordetella sp. TaxID=28081 RepID=UPI002ED3A602